MSKTNKSATQILSNYVNDFKYENIPSDVVEAAKWLILDSVGNSIGGYNLKPGKVMNEFYKNMGEKEDATVLATGKKLPLLNAVYINSYLANVLDFDDTSTTGHPGAMIIPPALAVAETTAQSGKNIIAAVVAGYETSLRISKAIFPSPERFMKVFGTSNHQIFGSVVASSYLLGLNEKQMKTAFSLGANNAPVPCGNKVGMKLEDRPIAWIKNNYGWASMGGVLGSLLAKKGFIGNETILDGEEGFWIISGSDRCDFEGMISGLGEEYITPDVVFKPYGCCRWSHGTVEACEKIIEKNNVALDEIQAVEVVGFKTQKVYLNEKKPINTFEAQFSAPYLASLTLMGHSPAKGLYEEHINNAKVLELAEKVNISVDDEMENMYRKGIVQSKVVLKMNDGTEYEETVVDAKGSVNNPMTKDEISDKFYSITSPVIGRDKAEKVYETVMNLEGIENWTEVVSEIYH